ncbi:MAG: hypothetical protein II637_01325 [Bacteroidales bacterium]|nr:hypothetical protein [Bacteroidales bacterium]
MKIEITPEQQQILIDSMRDRIDKLYRMSEAYRDGGNKEAQMDCLEEKKRVQIVLEKIASL